MINNPAPCRFRKDLPGAAAARLCAQRRDAGTDAAEVEARLGAEHAPAGTSDA
ncbi:hypothetical protein AB0940_34165 [Streptomyces sp. NPDC006656]|uniref:hypothetical protein n=1 Tax=Streptomyces sp. NPDC006656 TaxID=3156899 RepID=UPI003456880A